MSGSTEPGRRGHGKIHPAGILDSALMESTNQHVTVLEQGTVDAHASHRMLGLIIVQNSILMVLLSALATTVEFAPTFLILSDAIAMEPVTQAPLVMILFSEILMRANTLVIQDRPLLQLLR